MDQSAYVERAEETEQQLVQRAQNAGFAAAWVIGECAAKWYRSHANGRTDKDFAAQVDMTGDQITQRRAVWEKFGEEGLHRNLSHLSWSHFREAVNWDDAKECLEWASDAEATVKEMAIWRRAKRGESLFLTPETPVEPENKTTPRTKVSDGVPASANRNRETRVTSPPAAKALEVETEAGAGCITDAAQQETEEPDRQAAADAILQVQELLIRIERIALKKQKEALAKILHKFCGKIQEAEDAAQMKVTAFCSELMQAWNAVDGFDRCANIGDQRKKHISARMKESFWMQNWSEALHRITTSEFCLGKNSKEWHANLDWFIRPETVGKIMEGVYGRRTVPAAVTQSKVESRDQRNQKAFEEVLGEQFGESGDEQLAVY